jgi:hypothetical protein
MKKTVSYLLVLSVGLISVGCTHDVDPHQKINEPGYYNGEMKAHGGNAAGAATPSDASGK